MKKEYIYFGIAAAVAVYLISKLRSPAPGVVSSLVPVSVGTGTAFDSRDPARVTAFTALASLAQSQGQQATRGAELTAGLEAERIRASAQSASLGVQRELGLAGLSAGLERARIGADTSLEQRRMDNAMQMDALRYMGEQANQAGMTSGIFSSIAAALRALGSQQRAQAGSSMGSSGSGQPGAIQRAIQRARGVPVPNIGPMTPPWNPYMYAGLSDPFQSGFYGTGPASGLLDYLPSDMFANIPITPWAGYEMPPLPPGRDASPVLYGEGMTSNWWDWPTTGPNESGGGFGDFSDYENWYWA